MVIIRRDFFPALFLFTCNFHYNISQKNILIQTFFLVGVYLSISVSISIYVSLLQEYFTSPIFKAHTIWGKERLNFSKKENIIWERKQTYSICLEGRSSLNRNGGLRFNLLSLIQNKTKASWSFRTLAHWKRTKECYWHLYLQQWDI